MGEIVFCASGCHCVGYEVCGDLFYLVFVKVLLFSTVPDVYVIADLLFLCERKK